MTRTRIAAIALAAILVVTQVGVLTEDAAGAMMFFASTTVVENQYIQHSAPVPHDQFGKASAISGDTLIVGTPGDDTQAVNDGAAHVFRHNGAIWSEEARLTAADGAANDQFGVAVDIDGDTAVVGAFADGGAALWGSAYVFQRTGTTWNQVRKLTVTGLVQPTPRLGWSVAISGDYIAVTAIGMSTVYVFKRDAGGAGGWSNVPVAVLPGGGGLFGESVSMSGNTLIVSARTATANWGRVFIYDATTNFSLVKFIQGPRTEAWGYRAAINGDLLVVGAPGVSTGTILSHGGVYVYQRDAGGVDNFGQVTLLKPGEVQTGNPMHRQMGNAVAVFGDIVVAGAISDDGYGTDSGSAYVFKSNAAGTTWSPLYKMYASNALAYKYFGFSVAASSDHVFVGSPGFIPQNGSLRGEGYSFDVDGGAPPPPPPPPPPGSAPAAPSNLVPTVVSATRIDLAWNDNSSNESSFKLQRMPQGGAWSTVVWPSANATSYSDTGVTAGTWCYRIRSHNTDGFSAFATSAPVCVTSGGGGPPPSGGPAAPSNVVATGVSASRIDITWTDNANDENSFKLQRRLSGGSWSTAAWPAANATSYSDTGLAAGTWCYRIRSHRPGGHSAYVETAPPCVTIGGGGGPPPTGGLAAPSNFTAVSPNTSRVNLAWQDNSSNEHSFKLQWAPAGTENWTTIWVFKDETSYAHTGLTAGSYCYRIRAQGSAGSSNYVLSEAQCVVTGTGGSSTIPGPAAPANFSAVASSQRVDLSWTDVATTEVGYKLQWRPAGGVWATLWVFPNAESFVHQAPVGTYCYRLRSYNAAGESSNYVLTDPLCVTVTS